MTLPVLFKWYTGRYLMLHFFASHCIQGKLTCNCPERQTLWYGLGWMERKDFKLGTPWSWLCWDHGG